MAAMGVDKYHFDEEYSHMFVPTGPHPSVALENPSSVQMDDYFLSADYSPYFKLKGIFILGHEMGHMWWGDLIRTEWWGNVWIKEGMAEVLGMFVLGAWDRLENP
jgi:aminopeptidase N